MIVKLPTEHHLAFLSLKLSESTLIKMSNCWKSHAATHLYSLRIFPVPVVTQLNRDM